MDTVNQMYAKGDEVRRRLPGRFENVAEKVSSGRRPGSTGPNVQRNMPGRTTGVADKVLTGSGRPPVGTMATPKTGLLPTQTLSRMGTLSRGGITGLLAAGGLGLFEIGRQTGFDPEKLGQAAAQLQKSIEEVANEAAEVARELGQPIQDFVGRVVLGYQSEMGGSNIDRDRIQRMISSGQDRALSNKDIIRMQTGGAKRMQGNYGPRVENLQSPAMRNEMQQQQLGFAAGDEVDVAALPEGLKAMYDSGPKGREGVENIAAKTDKFAEGDEVSRETNEIESALSDIQSVAPEAQVIQQVMTMVMELVQSGASEEEIVAALKQMGLDDEDIEQVMMMLAEQMQGQQDPIQAELSQMS